MTHPEPFDPYGRLNGRVETADNGVRVALSGEIDEHTAGALLLRVPEIAAGSTGDVLLDMDLVLFIDSSGLRALLDLRRRLTSEGRRLVLRNASGPVSRLLELTGMDGLLGSA